MTKPIVALCNFVFALKNYHVEKCFTRPQPCWRVGGWVGGWLGGWVGGAFANTIMKFKSP